MRRFYGKVGYAITKAEEGSDVYKDEVVEKMYYGDLLSFHSKWENSGDVNDNLIIGQKLSILADAFANENFSHIKYVELMGVKWKVIMIEPERPRLTLTLGGVYND